VRCTAPILGFAAVLAGCSSTGSGFGGQGDGGETDGMPGGGDATADVGAVDGPAADAGEGDVSVSDSGTVTAESGAGNEAGSGGEAGVMQTVEMTFYGWDDNSPPGNAIAYPKSGGFPTVHDAAGGTGTYADPITYATDKSELPIGTIVYAPVIEKYLVMEDLCGGCETDWTGSMKWHIDVWMNSDGTENANDLFACEDQWTQSATTIEIDPPPGRTVTTNPLFDPSTNVCRTIIRWVSWCVAHRVIRCAP
jgi:3D (Asp-Asp-Asp) domain-containing protein